MESKEKAKSIEEEIILYGNWLPERKIEDMKKELSFYNKQFKNNQNFEKTLRFHTYVSQIYPFSKPLVELANKMGKILKKNVEFIDSKGYSSVAEMFLDKNSRIDPGIVGFPDNFNNEPWWTLFVRGYPFSPSSETMNSWIILEGTKLLNDILEEKGFDIIAIPCFSVDYSLAGWSNELITSTDFFKDKKIRAHGITANVLSELGAIPVNILFARDVIPEMKNGNIVFAESGSPTTDKMLGFYNNVKYAYRPSIFETTTGPKYLVVRKNIWENMTNFEKEELKDIAYSTFLYSRMKNGNEDAEILSQLKREGRLVELPKQIIGDIQTATSKVLTDLQNRFPEARIILDSLQNFSQKQQLRIEAMEFKTEKKLPPRKNGTLIKILELKSSLPLIKILEFFSEKNINIEGIVWKVNKGFFSFNKRIVQTN